MSPHRLTPGQKRYNYRPFAMLEREGRNKIKGERKNDKLAHREREIIRANSHITSTDPLVTLYIIYHQCFLLPHPSICPLSHPLSISVRVCLSHLSGHFNCSFCFLVSCSELFGWVKQSRTAAYEAHIELTLNSGVNALH